MFKRQCILFSFLLLTFFQIQANPITETEALQLATNFHQLRSPSKLRSADVLKLVWQATGFGLRSASVPAFFIYNIGENQGFVIVSGEDAAKTILGYADEGSFRTDNMPENVRYWLNFYQQEIEALRDANLSTATVVSEQVSTIAAGSMTVAPLLGGIKWNQTDPYNLLCPWDAGANSHALAGCVAIAMTQIMKFHRWPVTGTGTHSYTDVTYGLQSVDFSKTTYDWDNMLGSYVSGATDKQDAAVATLIYQCGVAVNMAYSMTVSSSNIAKAAEAFVNHFGYDTEIQRYERLNYTSDEWNNLIKKELDNVRPVYFSASSDAGGHAFVCDGYDSNSLFHINWGWGGSSNGYFELSSLSTANPGVAGAAPEYTYLQSILTGIHKVDAINKATNQVVVYNTGLTSSKSSVPKISTNSFALSFIFGNMGTNTVSAKWGIGYIKDGSTILNKLVEYSSTYSSLAAGSYYTTVRTITITNPTVMSTAGTYRLYPIYLPKDSVSWSIMRGTPVLNNCMIVTVASNNGPATILPALKAPSLTLTKSPEPLSRLYQNKAINIDLTFQNNGSEFYSRVGLCLISTTDPGDRTYICESKVLCVAGETKTFHLTGTLTASPGSYYLQALFDSTNSNSTMNYKVFGPTNLNNMPMKVLPPPGPSVLKLNNIPSMSNGKVVSKTDTINLTASISNTGGYFNSRIIAFVFPKNGGQSLTYLTPKYVYIDSLQTQEVMLTGAPNLDPGEYNLSLYSYQNNKWNFFDPGSKATINFTVAEGNTSVRQTKETFSIHQDGNTLFIETNAEIQQSKLYDLYGRQVRKTSVEKEIPLEGLMPGVYLLQVQCYGKKHYERFLKR